MHKNGIIAVTGFVSLLSMVYSIQNVRIALSLVCYLWICLELSNMTAKLRDTEKVSACCEPHGPVAEDSDEEAVCPDSCECCAPDTEDWDHDTCSIMRKGVVKNISEGASFVRKAADQAPRRRVPVRSYRADDIPPSAAVRIDEKFPTLEAGYCEECGARDDRADGTPDEAPGGMPEGFSEEGYMETGLDTE